MKDTGISPDFFEDHFRSTLSSLTEGVLILDGAGVIRTCNFKAESILAKKREDLLGQSPADAGIRLIDKDRRPLEPDQFPSTLTLVNSQAYSNVVVGSQHPDDRIVWMSVNTLPLFRKGHKEPFAVVVTFADVTSRKNAEERLILQTRLLELLNQSRDPADSLREILSHIRNFSDIEAVAIRLRQADDFPYYETIGFPDDFVEAERYLCLHDERGDLCHDHQGHPLLACVCGLVIRGQVDNHFSFYTANGSFWTNCVSQLIEEVTEEDLRTQVRGRCVGYGYESIALIPLRTGDETVGLLQLNDHRPNRFTTESIEFFEQLSVNLAVAFRRMVAEDELRQQQAELSRLVKEQAATNRELALEINRHQDTAERLQEGRKLLRRVLDAVPNCIFVLDADSRFLLTNRAMAEMYGTTPEIMEGKTLPEAVDPGLFQPLEWDHLSRMNRGVIETGQAVCHPEVAFTQPGQAPRYFHTTKMPLNWDGDPDCLLGVAVEVTEQYRAKESLRHHQEQLEERVAERTTDLSRINAQLITEINNRIRTEEELRRSEARFRGLFEDSPIGLMEIDISNLLAAITRLKQQGVSDFKAWFREHPEIIHEAEIIDTNKAALGIYGARKKDDLLGSLARIQCEESGGSAMRELLTLVEGGTRFQGTTVNRRLDGRKIHIVFSWSVAPGFETNRARVLASIIDVTENRTLKQSLRMNEALLHSMATTAPLAYYIVNRHTGEILFFNSLFCEIWQVSHLEEAIRAGQLKDDDLIREARNLLVDPNRIGPIAYGLPENQDVAVVDDELPLVDGRTIRRLSSPILDTSGSYVARIYIFEDITARKQAENARLESEKRYRDLFELAPVALWEEDFSEVKRFIDSLKKDGVHDFPAYFQDHPEVVRDMMSRVKILNVNQATLDMCRASDRSQLLDNIHKLFTEQSYNEFIRELTAIARDETFLEFELPAMNLAGEKVDALLTWTIAPGHEADYDKGYVSVMDITSRKQAETARLESERRYRDLFEMAPVALWEEDFSEVKASIEALKDEGIHDFTSYFNEHPEMVRRLVSQVKILDVNQTALEMFQAKDRSELLANLDKFFLEDSYPEFIRELVAIATGQTAIEFEPANRNLSGERIDILLRWVVAPGHEEHCDKVYVSMMDITLRKQVEEEIRRYGIRLETLHEIDQAILAAESPDAIAEVALVHIRELIPCQRASVVLFDLAAGDTLILTSLAESGLHLQKEDHLPLSVFGDLEQLRSGHMHTVEDIRNLPPDDPTVQALISNNIRSFVNVPLLSRNDLVGSLNLGRSETGAFDPSHLEVAQEVADSLAIALQQSRLFQDLKKSEARWRTLVENAPARILTLDPAGQITFSNQPLAGHTPEQLEGRPIVDFVAPDNRDTFDQSIREVLVSGEVVQFETEVQTAGDTIRWYANRMGPITRDGRIEGVMLLNRDITRAKSVEHQIRASLLEKETLLREIHHRVKNNLQVISSLLDLQGEGIREPHLLQALAESRNRVRAMALIHQELYQSESLSRIDTSGYIRGLVTHLFRAYHLQDADISLDIRVDGISLGLDMAIPCGLIINELVTNALKYAFPPGHSGILRIHLESESPGRYSLTIGDNGCGLPESLDLDNPPSLGLRLVQLLTRQLGGNLEIDRTGGTTFRLIFSETTNRQLR